MTLVLMFGLIFAVVTGLLWYFDLPLGHAITAAVVITLLQYIMGPIILTVLYDIEFVDINLDSETWQLIEDTCKKGRNKEAKAWSYKGR